MSVTTPAGWYDDGSGTQRYWDGEQWTEHTNVQPATQSMPTSIAPAPGVSNKRRNTVVAAIVGVLVLAGAGVALAITLTGGDDSGPSAALLKAMNASTCSELRHYLSSAALRHTEDCTDADTARDRPSSVSIISTSINGDSATVRASFYDPSNHEQKTSTFAMVKEADTWKLDHGGGSSSASSDATSPDSYSPSSTWSYSPSSDPSAESDVVMECRREVDRYQQAADAYYRDHGDYPATGDVLDQEGYVSGPPNHIRYESNGETTPPTIVADGC